MLCGVDGWQFNFLFNWTSRSDTLAFPEGGHSGAKAIWNTSRPEQESFVKKGNFGTRANVEQERFSNSCIELSCIAIQIPRIYAEYRTFSPLLDCLIKQDIPIHKERHAN
jgi:hypothetical protein